MATGKPKVRIVCDPNPICLGRFSRYVRKVHRSPVSGSDPMGYLRFVQELLREHQYDVLLPVMRQQGRPDERARIPVR